MNYDEIVSRVRQEAGLGSRLEAVRTLGAVLETLGERITKQEAKDLAAQLPVELKAIVTSGKSEDPAVARFSLEEFYERVGARAEVHYGEAVERSRAVMRVLREAVSAGELQDILAQLPGEYAELFGAPPGGPGSASSVAA